VLDYLIEITGDADQLHPAVGEVAAVMSESLNSLGVEGRLRIRLTAVIGEVSTPTPLGPRQIRELQKRIAPELPGAGNWIISVRCVGRRRHSRVYET